MLINFSMDSKRGFSEAFYGPTRKGRMSFAEDIINGMVRDSLTTQLRSAAGQADLSWCFQRKESMILGKPCHERKFRQVMGLLRGSHSIAVSTCLEAAWTRSGSTVYQAMSAMNLTLRQFRRRGVPACTCARIAKATATISTISEGRHGGDP